MATSGSWNFSMTAAQVIQSAYEDLGVYAPGATISSADSTMALNRLNQIAKQWQGNSDMAPGMKIWTRQRLTLFLAKGQQRYVIGPAATDARATARYGRTTLSADEAASQTTLSITSNTDTTTYPGTTVTMTASDIIGIELDDGTIHWTAISGTPGATADISVGLTGAASSGNVVYWFTTRAQRFPVLEFASLREADGTDTQLSVYSDVEQYEGLTDKQADGDPTALLFEPLNIATAITFDAQPDDVTKVVNLAVLYPAEDYDQTTDDIAFPQEWFAALSWELAFRLSPSAGRWTPSMEQNRSNALAMARDLNPQRSSMYYQPNADGRA